MRKCFLLCNIQEQKPPVNTKEFRTYGKHAVHFIPCHVKDHSHSLYAYCWICRVVTSLNLRFGNVDIMPMMLDLGEWDLEIRG